MLLCFPGWACQRSLATWKGKEATVVGHKEQWSYLEEDSFDGSWLPEGDWELLTWSMGTWTGIAFSKHWKKNPPKKWYALSPFLELCGEGGKVKRQDLDVLIASFRKNPRGTLGMFQKRQGGKILWSDGLEEDDDKLLGRSLEALLEPCPWSLADGAERVPVLVELGDKDRLVSEVQSQRFANLFKGAEISIVEGKGHALFYEEAGES